METNKLTGAALDWAVCKAAGLLDAYPNVAKNFAKLHAKGTTAKYIFPSTDWSQGGPIIEREGITLDYFPDGGHSHGGEWLAQAWDDNGNSIAEEQSETILIAAMRCYVASKMGDEVEVPEELL